MKKAPFILIAAIIVFIVYNKTKNYEKENHHGTEIRNYSGVIKDVNGNTIELTSGLKVHLLGIKNDRTDVEMFVSASYIGKKVHLIPDSGKEQEIPSSKSTVNAYVIIDENGLCLNRLIAEEYRDAYTEIELRDSSFYKPGAPLIPKNNLALFMKQRTFLIITEGGIGTGFFINEHGLALTNWHVLKPEQESTSSIILYQTDPDDSKMYSDKRRKIKNILWSQDRNGMDITIFSVELENGESVPYFDLAKSHVTQGERCATYGNPGREGEVMTASFTSGDISAYRELSDRPGLMMVQYSMGTNPGNSGGPVCDKYGRIIAVHELGDKTMQNTNYGIDILAIREKLNQMNLKYGGK